MQPGWQRTTVDGKAVDWFTPPGVDKPRFATLYLHPVGLEALADNAVFTAELARHGLACVAPQGARSWWTDRVCPEFDETLTAECHLLNNVLPWLREQFQLGEAPIGTFGISMGGQGAVRLGFKYPQRFPVVASIAGAFDYHEWYGQGTPIDTMYRSQEACRQDTAILQIHPVKYPPFIWFACDLADTTWYRGNDRMHEKLKAMGVQHTALLHETGLGHTWDYFNSQAEPALAYLVQSLTVQSRRLM